MPIIYRQSFQSIHHDDSDDDTIRSRSPDPDDSIVLSDLVRTGEASRLRRRGAMRLDHGYNSQQNNQAQGSYSNVIIVGSPPWESEPEDIQPSSYARERTRDRTRPRRNGTVDEESQYVYTIFCGGEGEDTEDTCQWDEPSSFRPSPLPLCPSSSSRTKRTPKLTRRPKTNGCGAVLHVAAAPIKRQHAWQASTDATDAVVSLDPRYFDRNIASKIVRSGCGCFREGIACAVCGNTVGTRYRGCQTSDSEHGPTTRHKPPTPLRPEGARYWRPHDRRPDSNAFIYTFVASQVSCSPSYRFPSMYRGSTIRETYPSNRGVTAADTGFASGGRQLQPNGPVFGDRIMTASPVPLSDLGEEDRDELGYSNIRAPSPLPPLPMATPLRYDDYSDGEMEPNSPDKFDAPMLFPER